MWPFQTCPRKPVEEIGRLVATGKPNRLLRHLQSCAKCRAIYEQVRSNEKFADDLSNAWGGEQEEELRRRAIEISYKLLRRNESVMAAKSPATDRAVKE